MYLFMALHLFVKCKHCRSACILRRCIHAVRLLCAALHSTCSYHMMCCFGIAKTYRHHDALLQSHSASHAMVFLFPEGKGWLAPPLKTFHLAPERGSRASRAPPPFESSLEKRFFLTLVEMSRKSEKRQYARDSKKENPTTNHHLEHK